MNRYEKIDISMSNNIKKCSENNIFEFMIMYGFSYCKHSCIIKTTVCSMYGRCIYSNYTHLSCSQCNKFSYNYTYNSIYDDIIEFLGVDVNNYKYNGNYILHTGILL